MSRRLTQRSPAKADRKVPVESRRFTASAEDSGRRLDVYLAAQLPDLSRTRIQELIDQGFVRVGKQRPRRAQHISAGDLVEIDLPPRHPLAAKPEDIPIEFLYEDDDFVVVNKPAGMVVHAGAGISHGTLVNALLHRLGQLSTAGGDARPGIVHRLDRGTSGAIIVARNDFAHRELAEQFSSRTMRKTYVALVTGRLSRDAGTIAFPITRDPRRRTRMTARLAKGRAARTDWRLLLRIGNFSLVAAEPRTRRTHQIRAHFAADGHPLVGDTLYGAPQSPTAGGKQLNSLDRVFLHAARLEFAHPRTGEPVQIRAALDPSLRSYLQEVGSAVEMDPREIDAALREYM